METYKKPLIVHVDSATGIFPLVGLSAAKLAVVGVAAGLGLASLKGDNIIDSTHTSVLTARKNFAFT